MAKKICKMPGCGKTLYSGNTQGLCRDHNHMSPYCGCIQCQAGRPTYRQRTRQEMLDAGYLVVSPKKEAP